MRFSPTLLLPGAIVGSLIVAMFGYIVTDGAAPLTQIDSSQPLSEQTLEEDVSGVDLTAGASSAQSETSAEEIICGINPNYPASIQQWCELITKYATARELDPNLVAAVMLQESGGDPLAYSRSGAVGLLQVMPRDGKAANFQCINGPCFASRPTTAELQDPSFNIEYGTGMIANLLAKTGSLREALYKYGPMDMGYAYADKVLAIYERHR